MADDYIDLDDALCALAIMGDLSMGQPIDHSQRVVALSIKLATHLGWDAASLRHVQQIAQLRWAGCTANATEFAATIGDDVGGRALMLQLQFEKMEFLVPPDAMAARVSMVSAIHCDVSSLIASSLGLDTAVSAALGCVFEHWDGSGNPNAVSGEAIPAAAVVVAVCSELEVISRLHGLPKSLAILRQRADKVYPANLVACLETHAEDWFSLIQLSPRPSHRANAGSRIRMDILGHVIELKLPWLLGHSKLVARLVNAIATEMELSNDMRASLRGAAWLHSFGRVAVPNAIWNQPGGLTTGDMEQVRLSPYWTSRLGQNVAGLKDAAGIAASAYERLDGSGYFRGSDAKSVPIGGRILAAAVAWTALVSDRPWRGALNVDAAMIQLQSEVDAGRFDAQVVRSLAQCVAPGFVTTENLVSTSPLLTLRELEVLRRVSLGDSNKVAAQNLGISPSTVRTHLESIFVKLGCKTRAACTLQASLLGLFSPA